MDRCVWGPLPSVTRIEPSERSFPDFYARQSPACARDLSRFRPCTGVDEEMNRAAWAQIRLG
ncbi:conserved protein of unknown function [Streptomyces murinus]